MNPYGDRNPYSSAREHNTFSKLPSWKRTMLNRQRYLRELGSGVPPSGIPLDDIVCRICQADIVLTTNGIPHQVRCAQGHMYTPESQNKYGEGISSAPSVSRVNRQSSPWYADQIANQDMLCECGSTYAMHNGGGLSHAFKPSRTP